MKAAQLSKPRANAWLPSLGGLDKSFSTVLHCLEPLSAHTSLQLGGEADYFVNASSLQQINQSISFARQRTLNWMVLGNGTNVLFPDEGYRGLIIHLGHNWGGWQLEAGGRLRCCSGASLGGLLGWLGQRGHHKLDFLVGIPGSVGGAVAMNAGIPQATIGARVESVRALNLEGRLLKLDREACRFGYRTSLFRRPGWVVLEVALHLGESAECRQEDWDMARLLVRRRACQPLRGHSAGCVFKNPAPPQPSAGVLLERAGLKGMRIGGASISALHANFILNRGEASSREVRQLIDIARDKVYKEFEVELQLELAVVSN